MTWTAPEVPRPQAPREAGERDALTGWIDFHRATLMHKCAGLTAGQLKQRAVPPSRLSLLGLVRHMAEVERWWFRRYVTAEDVAPLYVTREDLDAEFNDIDSADAEADLAVFAREVAAAREAVRGRQLDETVPQRYRAEDGYLVKAADIRWIYLHMIEEYARHNGHADLIREVIDGTTGL